MSATVIPWRPFESVALQLQRHGNTHMRARYFRRVHAELRAGHDGKRVAGEVSLDRHQQRTAPEGGAA